jgi:hypothetical protein
MIATRVRSAARRRPSGVVGVAATPNRSSSSAVRALSCFQLMPPARVGNFVPKAMFSAIDMLENTAGCWCTNRSPAA